MGSRDIRSDNAFVNIKPNGSDTGTSLNLEKRINLIKSYLNIQGKKVIDCGCGSGQYLQAFLHQGADAYGIEYEREKVDRIGYPKVSRKVLVGDIESIAFPSESFDIALLNEVLEHVQNETKALLEIHRVLKPGGILIVFSPNRLYPFETHSVFLKNSNRRLPIYLPFIPYIPLSFGKKFFDYVARNYWPHELRKQILDCNFTIKRTNYVWQTFENISGSQPNIVFRLKPFLRFAFSLFELIPGIRIFGVSQMVIAHKS